MEGKGIVGKSDWRGGWACEWGFCGGIWGENYCLCCCMVDYVG